MRTVGLSLTLGVLSASCSVPDATAIPAPGDAGGSDTGAACAPDEKSCVDATTPRRCVDGRWVEQAPCPEKLGTCYDGDCVECVDRSACPADDECVTRGCSEEHECVATNAARNTPLAEQVVGDCKLRVCDGSGATEERVDDTDTREAEECTLYGCASGSVTETHMETASCGLNGACNDSGACVEPVSDCGDVHGLQPNSPWPMVGYCPSHQGRSPHAGPASLSIVAKSDLDQGWTWTAAVAVDGTIYMGGGDTEDLHAWRPDGTLKWKYPAKLAGCPAIGRDGTIYAKGAKTNSNVLYAILPNGSTRWSSEEVPGDLASCPAIAGDGTIVWAAGTILMGFDEAGHVKWEHDLGGGNALGIPPVISPGGTIYVVTQAGNVYAFTPEGKAIWDYPYNAGAATGNMATDSDDTLYVGTDEGTLHAIKHDGSPKWQFIKQPFGFTNLSLAGDGTVYVGCTDRRVYAVKDGNEVWSFLAAGVPRTYIVVDRNGRIYFSSHDTFPRYTYVLNPDGSELHRLAGVTSAGALDAHQHLIGQENTTPGITHFVLLGEI